MKILIPGFVLLFIVAGVLSGHRAIYLEEKAILAMILKWGWIPILLVSLLCSLYILFNEQAKGAIWKRSLLCIALTAVFFLMIGRASQGYLTAYNCNFGQQQAYVLTGEVVRLDYPKTKKIFNHYRAVIRRSPEHDTIVLNVPDNTYYLGQSISKQMMMGSLGFIYSKQ